MLNKEFRLMIKIFVVGALAFQGGCKAPVEHVFKSTLRNYANYTVIGKTELASLPDFALSNLEMKVDTGAQTSSMHAFDITEFEKNGEKYVRFKTNPYRKSEKIVELETKLVAKRSVKGTCGKASIRPVIRSALKFGSFIKDIEFTLNDRSMMKYRFLLGCDALEEGILINPNEEFLLKKQ